MFSLDFFKPREKFLLLDIAPGRTSGILLSLDEERNLIPEKFLDNFSFNDDWLHKIKNLKKRKLIVSADSAVVTTVSFPLALQRDQRIAQQPITITELETLISQAIAKEFNYRRKEASKKLGFHELDTILVNAKAENFKIDKHLIVNPLGFSGKTIELILELTFTTREIFENLKNFFNDRDGFFFTETARAGLRALARVESPPVNLLFLRHGDSSLFILEKVAWGHGVYHETLDWPFDSLFESIRASIPASPDIVLRIYHSFLNENMSENFKKTLLKTMKPEIDKLFAAVNSSSKLRGRIYLHSPVSLPLELPLRRGRAVISEPPLRNVLEKFGFNVDVSLWPYSDGEIFTRLAPFLDFYHSRSDSEINNKLRRRLHWLIQ